MEERVAVQKGNGERYDWRDREAGSGKRVACEAGALPERTSQALAGRRVQVGIQGLTSSTGGSLTAPHGERQFAEVGPRPSAVPRS